MGIRAGLQKVVKTIATKNIFQKKIPPAGISKRFGEMFTSLYELQAYGCKAGFASMSVPLYGCSEVRVVMSGGEVVGGIRLPASASAQGYGAFAKAMSALDGAALAQEFHKDGNFYCTLSEGDVVFLPAGFLQFTFSTAGSLCFRKCVSPPMDGEDDIVRHTCAMVLEAHPEFQRSTMAAWHGYLSGQVE